MYHRCVTRNVVIKEVGAQEKEMCCSQCKSIPQGWTAGWGRRSNTTRKVAQRASGMGDKAHALWAGMSVQPICSIWSWRFSFGRVAAFSDTVVLLLMLLGQLQWLFMLVTGPCDSLCTANKLSISWHELFSVWAVFLKGPQNRKVPGPFAHLGLFLSRREELLTPSKGCHIRLQVILSSFWV